MFCEPSHYEGFDYCDNGIWYCIGNNVLFML